MARALEEGAQKEEAEVVAGVREDGVGAVAVAALEAVAAHRVLAYRWPMTGSTAARHFIPRRTVLVILHIWPVIHTRNLCG